MKKLKLIMNKIILIIIATILIVLSIEEGVKAFPISNRTFSVYDYSRENKLNNNISFDGVFDSYKWYFNITDTRGLDNIKLILNFEATDVLNDGLGSYLTFSVNNIKFYTRKIFSNNGDEQTITLDLPKRLVKNGNNELKVEGYLRISDMPCTDDYNTANWLVLSDSSSLNILERNTIYEDKISSFPYGLIEENGLETTIIIPDDFNDGELSAALRFQILLGSLGGRGNLVKWGSRGALENSNIVYIGRKESIPNELAPIAENLDNDILDETSLIKVGKSPLSGRDDTKGIAIISQSGSELISAVRFLMNKEQISQVGTNKTYINSKINVDDKIKEDKGVITFNDLGYNEMKFEGLYRRSVIMGYKLPKNRRLGTGDLIHLNFRYSENLNFNDSLFTVYINNTPIGSKKLEKDKAGADSLSIVIPEDISNTSYVEIKLAFDLNLFKVECEKIQQEQPWALVTGDSYLELNTRNIDNYYFPSYPAPFVEDWDLNNALLIIPDEVSSGELSSLGNMASLIGESVKYNIGGFEAIRISSLNKEHEDKNLIIYGTPEDNRLIKDINEALWFKYDKDYTKFLSNEKLNLLDDFSMNMTTFQLDYSYYNKGKLMLVLTSPNRVVLEKSLIFLGDGKELEKLSGDGAVIDSEGNVRNYKYKEEEKKPSYTKRISKLASSEKILLVLMVAVAVFILIAIGLYIYKNKYSKKH